MMDNNILCCRAFNSVTWHQILEGELFEKSLEDSHRWGCSCSVEWQRDAHENFELCLTSPSKPVHSPPAACWPPVWRGDCGCCADIHHPGFRPVLALPGPLLAQGQHVGALDRSGPWGDEQWSGGGQGIGNILLSKWCHLSLKTIGHTSKGSTK